MQATHTVAYRLRGLSAKVAAPPRVLLPGLDSSITITLTQDPTEEATQAWRWIALANVLLNGLAGRRGEGEVEELIQTEYDAEVERTQQRFGKGPYLIFSREGTVDDFECPHQRSHKSFDIGLDGPPATAFKGPSIPFLRDVLAALTLRIPEFSGYDEILNNVVYTRDDGRPFYVFHPNATASAVVGHAIPDDVWDSLDETLATLPKSDELDSVFRLLRTSLESHGDRLRAFLAAWFGLEILVGKLFKQYETAFFDRIKAHAAGNNTSMPHVDRIQDVMSDKYRLSDRFSLIATELVEGDATPDIEAFRKAQKVRNDLLHGTDIKDSALPVGQVRDLLRRHLELHLVRSTDGV